MYNICSRVRLAFWWTLVFDLTLGGTPGDYFEENKSIQKSLKSIWIDSVFCADFKYVILFDKMPTYFHEIRSKLVRKVLFSYREHNVYTVTILAQIGIEWIIYQFVALSFLYRMIYNRGWLIRKNMSYGSHYCSVERFECYPSGRMVFLMSRVLMK